MKNLTFTLKAWPVIAGATIGLCYLTQTIAKAFGVDLPDQQNVEVVRQWGLHALDSLNNFGVFAFLCFQVLVLMPALEEVVFRVLLFKLPVRLLERKGAKIAAATVAIGVISAALFSAAHYLAQPWPDAAFLALFFFGLSQCWLYRRTGRLWCAMLNHALFNLTNLVLLFILPAQAQ